MMDDGGENVRNFSGPTYDCSTVMSVASMICVLPLPVSYPAATCHQGAFEHADHSCVSRVLAPRSFADHWVHSHTLTTAGDGPSIMLSFLRISVSHFSQSREESRKLHL